MLYWEVEKVFSHGTVLPLLSLFLSIPIVPLPRSLLAKGQFSSASLLWETGVIVLVVFAFVSISWRQTVQAWVVEQVLQKHRATVQGMGLEYGRLHVCKDEEGI